MTTQKQNEAGRIRNEHTHLRSEIARRISQRLGGYANARSESDGRVWINKADRNGNDESRYATQVEINTATVAELMADENGR